MYNIFVDSKYQRLNRVYAAMNDLGLSGDQWKKDVQPVDIELEAWIDPSKNMVTFQTRKGTNNTDNPDENRIDTNDLVFFDRLALGIRKVDKSTTPFNYSTSPVYFYPESNVFVGTKSGNVAEAAALETVYGGGLALRTGNFTIFDQVKTQRFRKVPTNPFAVATTTPAANAQHAEFSLDSALHEFAQIFCLWGSQNYNFELTYGTGDRTISDGSYNAAGSTQAATRNQLVLFAQGYKVVGGAMSAMSADLSRSRF